MPEDDDAVKVEGVLQRMSIRALEQQVTVLQLAVHTLNRRQTDIDSLLEELMRGWREHGYADVKPAMRLVEKNENGDEDTEGPAV